MDDKLLYLDDNKNHINSFFKEYNIPFYINKTNHFVDNDEIKEISNTPLTSSQIPIYDFYYDYSLNVTCTSASDSNIKTFDCTSNDDTIERLKADNTLTQETEPPNNTVYKVIKSDQVSNKFTIKCDISDTNCIEPNNTKLKLNKKDDIETQITSKLNLIGKSTKDLHDEFKTPKIYLNFLRKLSVLGNIKIFELITIISKKKSSGESYEFQEHPSKVRFDLNNISILQNTLEEDKWGVIPIYMYGEDINNNNGHAIAIFIYNSSFYMFDPNGSIWKNNFEGEEKKWGNNYEDVKQKWSPYYYFSLKCNSVVNPKKVLDFLLEDSIHTDVLRYLKSGGVCTSVLLTIIFLININKFQNKKQIENYIVFRNKQWEKYNPPKSNLVEFKNKINKNTNFQSIDLSNKSYTDLIDLITEQKQKQKKEDVLTDLYGFKPYNSWDFDTHQNGDTFNLHKRLEMLKDRVDPIWIETHVLMLQLIFERYNSNMTSKSNTIYIIKWKAIPYLDFGEDNIKLRTFYNKLHQFIKEKLSSLPPNKTIRDLELNEIENIIIKVNDKKGYDQYKYITNYFFDNFQTYNLAGYDFPVDQYKAFYTPNKAQEYLTKFLEVYTDSSIPSDRKQKIKFILHCEDYELGAEPNPADKNNKNEFSIHINSYDDIKSNLNNLNNFNNLKSENLGRIYRETNETNDILITNLDSNYNIKHTINIIKEHKLYIVNVHCTSGQADDNINELLAFIGEIKNKHRSDYNNFQYTLIIGGDSNIYYGNNSNNIITFYNKLKAKYSGFDLYLSKHTVKKTREANYFTNAQTAYKSGEESSESMFILLFKTQELEISYNTNLFYILTNDTVDSGYILEALTGYETDDEPTVGNCFEVNKSVAIPKTQNNGDKSLIKKIKRLFSDHVPISINILQKSSDININITFSNNMSLIGKRGIKSSEIVIKNFTSSIPSNKEFKDISTEISKQFMESRDRELSLLQFIKSENIVINQTHILKFSEEIKKKVFLK